jgi:hypothetical protein
MRICEASDEVRSISAGLGAERICAREWPSVARMSTVPPRVLPSTEALR